MNFFLETLRFIVLHIYFTLEAVVLLFIPVRKKNVVGEIVLITGAGSGIGRLMALKFARLGATLVLWDINLEGNKETAKLARKIGAERVHDYICDCSKRKEIYGTADQVKKEVGDVSILINNAGIVTGKKFLDCPDLLIEKTIEVNTMAHFWTVKAFLPAMVASNHGHVVTIASSAGLIGVTGLADYCASKFAAVGFAESLAVELLSMGKTGVKSTIVCPYFINTGMFDGCQTKWPHVLPILDAEYAAEKIVSAVLRDQIYVYMPRSIYFFSALKSILSAKLFFLAGDYVGAFHFMDKFRGRTKTTGEKISEINNKNSKFT
ncbi:epidermal retinol dehydrogenase 2-like [Sceloporus undulatus]|uniref:epidermal retinol dehydrogenase 2-like n=1 Tax=Sceloporus undulatus TaxID=8520 RepID=UPI001C4D7737|nr:epidermal retinol dehydrogenase 2-like [Sceloporus undulatus]XP_042318842.1 epidermal retinol dehydrogenase 2-like [Sceloporus undulatus]XP_042318843.1 epidermal retinol dehydrogenase 2-like [Sceloporus undulatus]XP_042318844.1 epidermal retinol dehydrogenase 2-like [Sceloporus undulatus]XP_042318845.1 epidermal retinol dehydrogenase 2-like [Sceloporus undulatus]